MSSIKIWFFTCAILVIIMVWIGGITRLTDSGLSITEWKPITGIFPPFTAQEWSKEKAKYENTPEYQHKNFNITLAEFQKIYIIEYIHRLFGRIIGLVFAIPAIYFIVKNKLKKTQILLIIAILALGLLQGFMGWYMVQSGLNNQWYVSHYRLAAHLLLATIIFMMLWWQFCHTTKITIQNIKSKTLCKTLIILTILQITLGGLLAGLDGGLICNTFPLMNGELIPHDMLFISPVWKNFFDNTTTVQFLHRLVGITILIVSIILHYMNKTKCTYALLIAIVSQIIFGVLTLIYYVPISIASIHQVNAFLILALSMFFYRRIK